MPLHGALSSSSAGPRPLTCSFAPSPPAGRLLSAFLALMPSLLLLPTGFYRLFLPCCFRCSLFSCCLAAYRLIGFSCLFAFLSPPPSPSAGRLVGFPRLVLGFSLFSLSLWRLIGFPCLVLRFIFFFSFRLAAFLGVKLLSYLHFAIYIILFSVSLLFFTSLVFFSFLCFCFFVRLFYYPLCPSLFLSSCFSLCLISIYSCYLYVSFCFICSCLL